MPADTRLERFGPQVKRFIAHYLAQWKPYRPFWNYEDGCIYKGCLDLAAATGESAFATSCMRAGLGTRVGPTARMQGFDPNEFNIDNVSAGQSAVPVARAHGRETAFVLAIESQQAQLERHPRTRSGNFWHKKIYPHQVWLDGLYMAQPFRCAYASSRASPEILDDVTQQFAHVRAMMRDTTSGLYYHGWDESRSERWSNPRHRLLALLLGTRDGLVHDGARGLLRADRHAACTRGARPRDVLVDDAQRHERCAHARAQPAADCGFRCSIRARAQGTTKRHPRR